MTIQTAKRLLSINIESLTLEQLQKHKVRLLDAWREAKGEYGYNNGFFLIVADSSASGFTPKDMFLESNLRFRYEQAVKREQDLLK